MKYKISNIDLNKTIKKYKLCKNGIKVKYLKGSKLIPYTKTNFDILRTTMEQQAISFINDSKYDIQIEKSKKYNCAFSLAQLGCLGSCLLKMIFKQYHSAVIPLGIYGILCISHIFFKVGTIKYKLYREKYEKFIEYRETIDKYFSYYGRKIEVNSLDKISYRDFWLLLVMANDFCNLGIHENEISTDLLPKLVYKLGTIK